MFLTFFLLFAGCNANDTATSAAPAATVGVTTASVVEAPLEFELQGRIEASRTAEVRARVTGLVLERVFEEGALVEQGDVLFRIDPAPLRAALAQARAQVGVAEANHLIAKQTAERLAPLAGTRAVSAQTYDDATAGVAQTKAALDLARAAQTTASLNLEYATVTAPISGRIGRAMVTEGALVTATENTPLARIVQLDPVYVNLTVPVSRLRDIQRTRKASDGDAAAGTVSLFDGDWTHDQEGTLLFTDVTVDPQTGSTLLRASVPNPQQDLLPGMYVRARVGGGALTQQVASVPQQAVQRSADGASVLVVRDNVAVRQPVTLGQSRADALLVTGGLSEGDLVIADGFQQVREGAPVNTVPWEPTRASSEEL